MTFRWPALLPLLLGSACAGAPTPCTGSRGCPLGRECLASRCTTEGGAPVPPETRRILLRPAALALAGRQPARGLAPSITFGSRASAPCALYVRFDQSWRSGTVRAAFLLLEPRAGAAFGPDVELEVWRAHRPWSAAAFSWSKQPGFAPPFARAIGRSAPALPVRVDVTEIVRHFAEHPEQDFGFAVRADDEGGTGITLSTGIDGGSAPRLDVYLDPP